MAFDWKELVRTVAPTLADALGGPLAGIATQAISTAILGKSDGSHDEISQALAVATPETLMALKKADQDFEIKKRELVNEDRDSARKREEVVKDKVPAKLALYTVLSTLVITLLVIVAVINGKDIPSGLAALVGAAVMNTFADMKIVMTYYFGGSADSDAKTTALSDVIKDKAQ